MVSKVEVMTELVLCSGPLSLSLSRQYELALRGVFPPQDADQLLSEAIANLTLRNHHWEIAKGGGQNVSLQLGEPLVAT